MSYRGAKDLRFHRFSGGLVEDTDATEIGAEQCAACENVDLEDETVSKRLGRVAYNSTTAHASSVCHNIGAYYPSTGNRSLLIAAAADITGDVYADLNQDGDFGDASEGSLWFGTPAQVALMEFIQFRDVLYLTGAGGSSFFRWGGSGSGAVVANPTAPAAAPTVGGQQSLLESFEDHTDWTVVAGPGTGSLAKADESGLAVGTDACLKLTVSATNQQRSYLHKSFASTQDLSGVQKLVLWGRSNVAKLQIKVAIYEDGDTVGTTAVDWEKFPVLTFETADQWEAFEISLAGIAPTSRDAVPGMAVMYLTGGGTAAEIYLDDLKPALDLDPGQYHYYYTYYDSGTGQESGPSAAATLDVSADAPLKHVNITTVATAGTDWDGNTLDKIRIYRARADGADVFGGEAVLVKEVANASATYTDQKTNGMLVVEAPARLRTYRADPPFAQTFCLANGRMFGGNGHFGSSAAFPYRLFMSRFNKPEEWGNVERPDKDVLGPGYIDLTGREHIIRLVEWAGALTILCDRAIYTLEGDGWDNFALKKRADVGVSGRKAVAASGQYLYFLSHDGVRVMVPEVVDADGKFRTWVISEPVDSRLRTIPAAYRPKAVLGIDHRERLHVSYTSAAASVNDKALVFNPKAKGALGRAYDPLRGGWTYYSNWGFSCFYTLKRGVTAGSYKDNGQLMGGDPSAGKLHYLLRDGTDTALETDDGSDIAWSWTSRAVDAGSEGLLEIEGVFAEFDPAANEDVTASLILDRDTASPVTSTLSLGAATTGIRAIRNRVPLGTSARYAQLKLSGEQGVALKVRSAGIAVYRRR